MSRNLLIVVLVCLVPMSWGCGTYITKNGKTARQWARQLESDDRQARMDAIVALAEICEHERSSVRYLAEALKDPSPDNRMAAVKMLENLGASAAEAVPALESLSKTDDQDYIRKSAEAALVAIRQSPTKQ